MEDLTGRQLGPYQIVAPLGEGGMAAVYKAYQPNMDRYVALKVLPRHFADDPEFVQRFTREARVIANLQHPHILPVHDFGESEGYTYMAMRFIRGGILSDWIANNQPLSLPQIRRIISQVGDALDYAHGQGVVHRDVKPSNVLIDERGNCLLTDFGLAKMVQASVKLTRTGGILGTPAYMSPEQGMGQGIDHRSDIYALGVILYEMVTGRPPYQAETPMAIMIKHIQAPLPPPHRYQPALSEDVERVILKSLAKEKDDRYATAGDMVQALQQATAHPTIATGAARPTVAAIRPPQEQEMETAVPTSPPTPAATTPSPQTPSPRKRRTRLYAVIGIVVMAVVGFILLSLLDSGPSEIEPFTGETPAEVESIVDEAFTKWDNGELEAALEGFDTAIEIEPGIAFLHCRRGELLENMDAVADAEESYATCLQIAEAAGDQGTVSHAFGSLTLAQVRQLIEEEADLESIRAILDDALADPAAPGWLICERGELNLGYADNESALADFEKCRQNVGDDDYWGFRSEAVINMIQGQDALDAEDYPTAVEHLERWAELDPEGPWAFCSLGYAYTGLEAFDQAHEAFTRCAEVAGVNDDPDLQKEAESGNFYVSAAEAKLNEAWAESLDAFTLAIELTPDTPWLYCERGEVFWSLNRLDEARADFELCLEMGEGNESLTDWAREALDELP